MSTTGVSAVRLAPRMELVPFSGIRKVFERGKALEREGHPVIFLETGRPDFDTPAHIKEAAKRALDAGDVHYTSNYGTPALRAAIADKLYRDNGLRYNPEGELLVTIGAAEAINVALMTLLGPGDEILYGDPNWLNYPAVARLAGAVPVPFPLRESNAYQIDVDEVRRAITPRTRMLVVVSPNNPTGAVQSPETLKQLAKLVVERDLLVLSDEIYEKIVYKQSTHLSLASLPGMWERTITVNGFSKAYSMTGWRLGYIAAPAEYILAINRVHQYTVACACSFAQAGAVAALKESQECVQTMVREFERRRNLFVPGINAVRGLNCLEPGGAFYAWVNIKQTGMSSEEFSLKLLETQYVSCVPGTVFGAAGEGCVRFSYANSYERLAETLERLKRFCNWF